MPKLEELIKNANMLKLEELNKNSIQCLVGLIKKITIKIRILLHLMLKRMFIC